MKYCFIINPNAGKGNPHSLVQQLEQYFSGTDYSYEIFYTTPERQGGAIAKELAQSGIIARIYACGGDGSLFDVVNGCVGYDNIEVGVIPCGTANDFIRTFGSRELFCDIDGQVKGSSTPIDLIKMEDKYSINICSIGMDAEVVNHTNRRRWLSRISGSFAYTISVFTAFIFNLKNHFTVIIDDDEPISGDYTFVVAANGRFYGGGYNPTPFAIQNDGYMDVMLMNTVSRLTVLRLLNRYRRGEHLTIEGLCTTRLARRLTVIGDHEMSVNMDGEIYRRSRAEFEVLHGGIKFILPAHVTAPECKRAKERRKYYTKLPTEAYGELSHR